MIGVQSDDRLQHRCGDLERESDQTDLSEIELKGILQDRIYRRDKRLNRVVKQVRKAGGNKNRQNGFVFRFRQSRTCLTAPRSFLHGPKGSIKLEHDATIKRRREGVKGDRWR